MCVCVCVCHHVQKKTAERDKRLKSAKRWAKKALKKRNGPIANAILALICYRDDASASHEHAKAARVQLNRRPGDMIDRTTWDITQFIFQHCEGLLTAV